MKILNTLSFILISIVCSHAQITYTNASFLQAGDILEISTTFDSTMVVTAPDTAATNWDFSGLLSTTYTEDTIRAASTGSSFAQFPTADVLGSLVGGFGTAYTDVDSVEMKTIGGGFEFGNISIIAPFADPYVIQKAPITYGDVNTDAFSLRIAEHIDSVPFLRQLIDSLGLFLSPDSIRFSFLGTANQKVDAFGTCELPDSTYNVLRQKNTIYTDIKIEFYTVFFGSGVWANVTSLVLSNLPGNISPKDTTVFYDYLAEGRKQPVVRQRMNSDESAVNSVEFKGESSPQSSIQNVQLSQTTTWQVFPNPAQTELNILFDEEQLMTTHQLQIVDLLGRERYKKTIQTQELQLNVQHWTAGQYIGIIRNNKNKVIATKRIQVSR